MSLLNLFTRSHRESLSVAITPGNSKSGAARGALPVRSREMEVMTAKGSSEVREARAPHLRGF